MQRLVHASPSNNVSEQGRPRSKFSLSHEAHFVTLNQSLTHLTGLHTEVMAHAANLSIYLFYLNCLSDNTLSTKAALVSGRQGRAGGEKE